MKTPQEVDHFVASQRKTFDDELDQLHTQQHAMRSEIERLNYELARSNETIRRFTAVFDKMTSEGKDVNSNMQLQDAVMALQAAQAMLAQRDTQIIQLQVMLNKITTEKAQDGKHDTDQPADKPEAGKPQKGGAVKPAN